MRILAVDQGTTSTRVLELTERGTRILGQRRHRTHHLPPDRVELEPLEILGHIRDLLAEAGPADGIALANQGETCLAWDGATGEPLSPLISWQDRRSLGILAEMESEGLGPEIAALSGLPLDPYFSAGKFAWMLRNVAGVARKGVRLGTSDAFFLDRLTGHFATDRATASRTGLMNLSTGAWDARLCTAFGVPMEALPEIRANTAGFGAVGGVPVLAAIVDQQAALYGHGCRRPGEGKITFGTGAFALALTEGRPGEVQGLLPTVAWDLGQGIRYAVDGGVQDAGSALEWALAAGLAKGVGDFDGFAAASAVGRGLVFVPAFSGLGAPHWDRSAAPVMIGLAPGMGRRDMVQALMEGVAYQTADLVAILGQVAGLRGPLSIDGGIAKSRFFAGFLADACGLDVQVSTEPECTGFGAAWMAAEVLGHPVAPVAGGVRHVAKAQPQAWRALFAAGLQRGRGWRGI